MPSMNIGGNPDTQGPPLPLHLVFNQEKDNSAQVKGLFISAIIFASIGFFSKLAAAAGLSMLDPVKLIQSQLVARAGGKLGAARIASVLNFLLDSLVSLAVVLIAIAIGLLNGYFDK
jgi:hypothetical protein